jgi:hypothetical protein
MALSNQTINDLIDDLTSVRAGLELSAAIVNGSVLSNYTYRRLITAMSNEEVAADIQAAILGTKALNLTDLRFMVDGFTNSGIAANVAANVAGGILASALPFITSIMPIQPNPIIPTNAPANISMPSAFTFFTSTVGQTAIQQVQLNLPAGSTFASTGPGASFQLFNAGNANSYTVWYNVTGGSNTNPTPAGFTGIEVTITSGETSAAIATATQAAIAAAVAGMTSSVASNVVTVIINAVIAQAGTPAFSLPSATYSAAQIITISSPTATASIYYTTNGSTPTTSSTPYVGPITVGATQTIKAIAVNPGFSNSAVASATYTISASPSLATQMVFTTEPVGAAQNVNFATMPIVAIQNSSNATVTTGPDSTALVTLAISSGTGTLLGTVSMNAVAGVANFSAANLQISLNGAKIISATKSATSGAGVLVGYSTSFNISNGLAPINLATAANYTILSESGISDTSGSAITGKMAVSPIAHTAITGFVLTLDGSGQFSTAPNVTGDIYAADYSAPTPATLTTAIGDMGTAYTNGQGRTSPNFTNLASGNLGGLTLTPGLYKWTTGVTIPTNCTVSGGPSDVFIFQIAGTLNISASTSIILSGGVVATNIFWVVAGAVTLGVSSVFEGIILGQTNIAVQTTATVHGSLYAQTAVTLDHSTITPT